MPAEIRKEYKERNNSHSGSNIEGNLNLPAVLNLIWGSQHYCGLFILKTTFSLGMGEDGGRESKDSIFCFFFLPLLSFICENLFPQLYFFKKKMATHIHTHKNPQIERVFAISIWIRLQRNSPGDCKAGSPLLLSHHLWNKWKWARVALLLQVIYWKAPRQRLFSATSFLPCQIIFKTAYYHLLSSVLKNNQWYLHSSK